MPLQNRVQPTGEILSDPARGLFMGNRGILHDAQKRLGRARWRHKAWVTCVLEHKDWHRDVMTPGAYTELFFLDEAVALAAGHRPCAMCRNADYKAFRKAAGLTGSAKEMDAVMHDERALPRRFAQRRHQVALKDLPDRAIILEDHPKLLLNGTLRSVLPGGYGAPTPLGAERIITLLTPPTSLRALRSGYVPRLHPSATST